MLQRAKDRNEIRVVNDQILTPTYTLDLANQIREVIKTQNYGTYHATNARGMSLQRLSLKFRE